MSIHLIRNFSIIAHIDHGKSSLADCFLEWTQAVDDRTKKDRFLDSMDLERERGITIKAQTVRLNFKYEPNKGLAGEGKSSLAGEGKSNLAGGSSMKGMANKLSDDRNEGLDSHVEVNSNKVSQIYQLNLIDTPGHVDFSYEVSRSLSACEGVLLVVDACQGIEAQTMANTLLALENNLEIIPVINKIDLPSQRIEEVKRQLVDLIGVKEEEILLASAKEKIGIQEILSAVVERIPSPKPILFSKDRSLSQESIAKATFTKENAPQETSVKEESINQGNISKENASKENASQGNISKENVSKENASQGNISKENVSQKNASHETSIKEHKDSSQFLRALIFDSWFDSYQGVIALCRIKQGSIKKGDKIFLMGTNKECEVLKLGVFTPFSKELEELKAGEVGFVITGIKEITDMKVGDTITHCTTKSIPPLEGFKEVRPMVYAGIFPISSDEFEALKKALEKLSLNDSSLTFEMESSKVLGFGFRCGFLGLLHKEIVQERLEREFELSLITTAPSVIYKTYLKKGEVLTVENPSLLPDPTHIDRLEEPFALVQIHTPSEYIGTLLKLCEEKRGSQQGIEYISSDKSILKYKIPLNEMILDFHDRLKSLSRGYASMDYELGGYEEADLVKMDVLLNGEIIDALSVIIHRSQAQQKGRYLAKRLKELIPRQQFQVAIQAAIGAKIIARETLGAYRKDVTAKLYGGDVTRKKKLLEKQKSGKKRMKAIGKIEVPQKAFMAFMKTDN